MTRVPMDSVRSQVKSILVSSLGLQHISAAEIHDDAVLFDGQFGVNSMVAISLITDLEQEFGIQFDDDEIGLELFQSVSSLTAAVGKHLNRQTVAGQGADATQNE